MMPDSTPAAGRSGTGDREMAAWNGPGSDHDAREPRPDEHQLRTYVTEIWCPPADDGVQRLHSPMKEPGCETEAEAGL
jgi:hypothetical protein